jgi:hypothetical protein
MRCVSKDGRDDGRASCHPSRRPALLRSAGLLRMRSGDFEPISFMESIHQIRPAGLRHPAMRVILRRCANDAAVKPLRVARDLAVEHVGIDQHRRGVLRHPIGGERGGLGQQTCWVTRKSRTSLLLSRLRQLTHRVQSMGVNVLRQLALRTQPKWLRTDLACSSSPSTFSFGRG